VAHQGDQRYREAFEHHWRSIRRWDRRNTGGFSSGEQATGNPYPPTAIETCCTVAWMAMTIDYLRLTGDRIAADDLELATLNGGLGAQHPSGCWWTYNTPMDGSREASAHTIVFQARAGTPELNCCSVNGPRVLGMLSEWAVMSATNGLVLNWLGAGNFKTQLARGEPVTITSSGEAWRDGHTELRLIAPTTRAFSLLIRIPGWAQEPQLHLNGKRFPGVVAGTYAKIDRAWSETDRLELDFKMPVRAIAGANEAAGKVSLYRGPILLAFDQSENAFDEDTLPLVNLDRLAEARLIIPKRTNLDPWLVLEVPTTGDRLLRLIDFANAGARGTHYRSWLAAQPARPAPAFTQIPADAARVPTGPVLFRWRMDRRKEHACRVEFSADAAFSNIAWKTNTTGKQITINSRELLPLAKSEGAPIYWRVVTSSGQSETLADVPPAWFRIDPSAPPQTSPPQIKLGPNGELISHSLRGAAEPEIGEVKPAKLAAQGADGTELNGRDQMLVYTVPSWPEEDFSISLRLLIKELPRGRLGQVFSAWAAGMDDPLRIVVDGEKLFARIEAGAAFSTAGAPIEAGRWYAVAAIKRGATLTLFLDGHLAGSCAIPEFLSTQAQDCALGGNPHFGGNEFLAARFADFRFHARALSNEEVMKFATPPGGRHP
jgi:hypothetical protein